MFTLTIDTLVEPPATRAVERALGIVHAVAARATPARLSDIAREAEVSKSTAHRLLRTLVARRFVARVGADYSLGDRLFELTEDQTDLDDLRQTLMPFLVELRERTGGAVGVAVCRNGRMVHSYPLHDGTSSARVADAIGRLFGGEAVQGRRDGDTDVAAPVYGPGNQLVAGIWVTGPRGVVDPAVAAAEVARVARLASAHLVRRAEPG
ncbi:helix-turn-helix domain-containing protein [Kutzneria sp. CA-103260]|uniref:helix-turn-helix domain-containing protein n=1 Tax=Kutzneria sp. CA-103260 TaxID=2802641 RepID=UPI001BA665A1|nr:helix-turn-helix domain-containing protein [Kutzneria sp. CA-103260]